MESHKRGTWLKFGRSAVREEINKVWCVMRVRVQAVQAGKKLLVKKTKYANAWILEVVCDF